MPFNKKLLTAIRTREAAEKSQAAAIRLDAAIADGMPALEAPEEMMLNTNHENDEKAAKIYIIEDLEELAAKGDATAIDLLAAFKNESIENPEKKEQVKRKKKDNMQCSYEYSDPQEGQNARCNRQIAPGFSRVYCGKHAIHDKAVQRYWPRCTRGRNYAIHKMTKRGRVWPWAFLTEVIRIMDIMGQIWGYKSLTDLDKFIASMPRGFEGPRCQFCMVADNAPAEHPFSIDEVAGADMPSPITPGQYFPDMETPSESPTSRQYSWGVATNMAGAVLSPTPRRQYSWGGADAMHAIHENERVFQFGTKEAGGPRVPCTPPAPPASANIPVDADGNIMVSFRSAPTGGPRAPRPVADSEARMTPIMVEPAFPINAPMTDAAYARIKCAANALSLDLNGLNTWRVGKAFVRTGDEESRDVLLEYLVSCS